MSIILPSSPDYDVVRICGIDPGTNYLGFSTIQFDFKTLNILSVEAASYKSEPMIDPDSFIRFTHNERIAKIYAQKDNLVQLFKYHRPHVVACENPFINRLRPAAYGPLMEVLFAIRAALIEYNPAIRFCTYEPSIVKKAVGAHAIGNKDAVKLAVTKNAELCPNALTGLGDLDEHAIDAIAVAYTHLCNFRKG